MRKYLPNVLAVSQLQAVCRSAPGYTVLLTLPSCTLRKIFQTPALPVPQLVCDESVNFMAYAWFTSTQCRRLKRCSKENEAGWWRHLDATLYLRGHSCQAGVKDQERVSSIQACHSPDHLASKRMSPTWLAWQLIRWSNSGLHFAAEQCVITNTQTCNIHI